MATASALRAESAARSLTSDPAAPARCVIARSSAEWAGFSDGQIRAQVDARRWQLVGQAVVLHNHQLTRAEQIECVLINYSPRCILTSFTSAELAGLDGWARDPIHVLVPRSAHRPALGAIPLRVHYIRDWTRAEIHSSLPHHRLDPALILAATGFTSARPACGILAAAVQQRLTTADRLEAALIRAPRARHRRLLALALGDIGLGSHALTELDFVRLCRRNHLPVPLRQSVRHDRQGRRRYLDAEWKLRNGNRLAVEVDGANHLRSEQWMADALRHNELTIAGTPTLRYPSVLVRTEEALVADQLRRAHDV